MFQFYLSLNMLFRFLFLSLLLLATASFAQKKKKASRNESQVTSVGPYYPDANKYAPKAKKKKSKHGISREAQNNFYAQREVVAKQKRKAEKTLAGVNYGDPTHFGHRHRPKKHKPEKMKLCKVCGIRH
jgi:membrane-bound lytic murein transglycosylase B